MTDNNTLLHFEPSSSIERSRKGRIADDHASAKMIIIVKSGNIKTCWLATGWGSTTIAPMIGLFGATYLAGQTPLLQRLATVVPLQIGPGAEQQEAKELLQASKKREEAM